MRQERTGEFSQTDTLAVKGLAVILMMIHHLLAFPWKLPEALQPVYLLPVPGTDYPGLLRLLADFGKVCVPLFFFLAGFGQYRGWQKRGGDFRLPGRLKRFFLSYWQVFVIFVPIALLCFAHQPQLYESSEIYSHYDRFDLFRLLKSFFGVEAVYNGEWWFIKPWLTCTLLLPLWAALISRRSLPVNLCFLMLMAVAHSLGEPFSRSTLWQLAFGQTAYSLCFYLGAILANGYELERLMERWRAHGLDRLRIELSLLMMLILLRLGWPAYNMEMSVFLVPVLVFLMTLVLRKCRRMTALCCLYGRHSTAIWLTHTFLCFYFLPCQKLVYFPRYAVLTVPWFMLLCLGLAIAISLFWKGIGKVTLDKHSR